MKIFVFGNSIIDSDSFPVKLIPALSKRFPAIEFIHADPNENWYQEEKELVIMDTIVGINETTLFHSLDEFEKQTRITPHDYDLFMDLQLLMKLGKIKKVTIIGLPPHGSTKTSQQTIKSISSLL
jgi:Ni,Fe-hydrogenase maturation factor